MKKRVIKSKPKANGLKQELSETQRKIRECENKLKKFREDIKADKHKILWSKWNTIAQFTIAAFIFVTIWLTYQNIQQQGEYNRQSLRPYVGILEIQGERKADNNLSLKLYLSNPGRTPANDLSIQILLEMKDSIKVSLGRKEIDVSKTRIIMSPFPASLFPQQLYIKTITIGSNYMDAIYSGEKDYILNIDIRYRGLTKIPEDDYYGYFIKIQYDPQKNVWDVLESNAW